MLYFIPAWYQENTWSEKEQIWYERRTHTEFDDTVKQVQLFQRSGAYEYRIMLLSFAPNFRHFIHRQSVYHAPYWSCFDAIQEIKKKKARVLSFYDLMWPDNIEFVYTPFVVYAMLHGERYAQIEFGEDGNPIQVDMYERGKLCRRNLYDDRGFVSGTIVYEEEIPVYEDYLMESGMRKLRHFRKDGHVEINPQCPQYLILREDKEETHTFSKMIYTSMEEVILEVLASYVACTNQEDIFCVAVHERNTAVLKEVFSNKKLILSFFENRYSNKTGMKEAIPIESADYVITDAEKNTRFVREAAGRNLKNIMDISPYDTRVDFGISQQLSVQKILVPVDQIEESVFRELVVYLGRYLPQNRNAQVHFFTRRADYNRKETLLQKTAEILKSAGLEEQLAMEEVEASGENKLELVEQEKRISERFFVEQCVDELSVSKCMREQRLILDMRNVPELYLRITAISVGIPQIVRKRSKFVEHKKNGLVIDEMKELPDALEYYLNGLNNWNEAMVSAYELGKKYTTKVLLDKWKEVIEFIG